MFHNDYVQNICESEMTKKNLHLAEILRLWATYSFSSDKIPTCKDLSPPRSCVMLTYPVAFYVMAWHEFLHICQNI